MGKLRCGRRHPVLSMMAVAGGLAALSTLAGCDVLLGLRGPGAAQGCQSGEVRCEGNVPQECVEGAWTSLAACDAVCSDGDCLGVRSLAAGGATTCALATDMLGKSQGVVLCWGNNKQGQCGQATRTVHVPPAKGEDQAIDPPETTIEMPDMQEIPGRVELPRSAIEISLGGDAESGHACALLIDRTVRCWGDNKYSQLGGAGDKGSSVSPVGVCGSGGCPWEGEVLHVRAGAGRTCVITGQRNAGAGELWCWGQGKAGQTVPGAAAVIKEPALIEAAGQVEDVALGVQHTCAVAGGKVRCWGNNETGQCGAAPSHGPQAVYEIPELADVRSLTAGDRHTCALTATGVVCWGEGSCGQLGSASACGQCGSESSAEKTMCAGALTAGPAIAGDDSLIAAGSRHTCLARPSGEVSCWGDNGHWQVVPALSQAPAGQSPFVADSSLLVLDKTSLLALGSQHGCALRKSGEVWCWGSNTLGQLGRGDKGEAASHASPDRVRWSFSND